MIVIYFCMVVFADNIKVAFTMAAFGAYSKVIVNKI